MTRLFTFSLAEDAGHVGPDRAFADEHSGGDLFVAESLGQVCQDFQFPPGQALYPVRLLPGRLGMGLGGGNGSRNHRHGAASGRSILRRRERSGPPGTASPESRPSRGSHALPALAVLSDTVPVFVRRKDHRPGFRVVLLSPAGASGSFPFRAFLTSSSNTSPFALRDGRLQLPLSARPLPSPAGPFPRATNPFQTFPE